MSCSFHDWLSEFRALHKTHTRGPNVESREALTEANQNATGVKRKPIETRRRNKTNNFTKGDVSKRIQIWCIFVWRCIPVFSWKSGAATIADANHTKTHPFRIALFSLRKMAPYLGCVNKVKMCASLFDLKFRWATTCEKLCSFGLRYITCWGLSCVKTSQNKSAKI